MHASGNAGDTCGAAWARPGENRWIGAAFLLPAPQDHDWSRLLTFSYYQCFHAAPWSVVGLVLTKGQLQVWAEDYGGGSRSVRLLAGVPAPAGRWFRADLGLLVGDPNGSVELVVDGVTYRATGATITRPGAYTSGQFGLGTVAGPAVTTWFDNAYIATNKKP